MWRRPAYGVDLGYTTEVSARVDYISIPDGRCGLVWARGDVWWLGPSTRPWRSTAVGKVVGVRLSFGAGRIFVGEPLHPWRDGCVPLSALTQAVGVYRAAESLARAAEGEHLPMLGGLVSSRLRSAGGLDLAAVSLAAQIGQGANVAALADSLDISPRQLLRQCNDLFGMPPSTLRKILRLHRAAKRDPDEGGRWAAVAAAEGYADESHLARDARALTLTSMRVASSHPVRFVQDAAAVSA
ncbi:hypothetical protein KEM60_02194 [Austwickia sp. TVS 96-490-7B]|nr:hypothetical protein [Austwickia sp. TVS 96-490-7B]